MENGDGWKEDSDKIYLDKFLEDPKVDLNKDYWKGYFIHLLTDYYFARVYFVKEIIDAKNNNDTFYHDYDCINEELINKYHVKVLDEIKKYLSCVNDEPRYLKINKVINFIETMSNLNLEEEVNLINSGEWRK